MNRFRALVPLSLIVFSFALIAGCGGGGSDQDPQEVLNESFAAGGDVNSGVLDLKIDVSAEGGSSGSASLSLNGPFQSSQEANQLPEFDLTASATASALGQDFNFDGGLTLTTDNAYVEYNGQAYEVGKQSFDQVQQLLDQVGAAQGGSTTGSSTTGEAPATLGNTIKQGCETAASQSGGDPSACDSIDTSDWTSSLSDEGTTDIDGTTCTHIHGDLDVANIVNGLIQISQAAAPSSAAVPAPSGDQISQVTSAITGASFDVYSGQDDHIVRGIDASLTIDPSSIPGASTLGIESVTLKFTTRLGSVNEPQTIQAPSNAKPLSDLLDQVGGLGIPGLGLGGIPGVGGIPGLPTQ